jgi:uncharacterized protein (DUF58 family)
MVVVMGVAILLAPDVENNFAYQAFALTFCTLLVSFAFAWKFRGTFSVERHLPRFGTVGKPVYYSVTVRNLGARPQGGLSILETLVDPRPAFPDWFEVQLFEERQLRSFRPGKRSKNPNPYKLAELREAPLLEMPPRQEVQAQLQLVPLRRGILRFSSITLARADPFGLCRAIRKIRLPQTMVVLPKRYRIPSIALPGNIKYQEGGVAMASKVGQSEEFVSLRDYRYGDPPRHIHWRSWAKSGKPVVKEFEDEFFVRHALILDTFSDRPYSQVFEEAVSVAASFACTLDTQDSLLDLLFVGPESYCFTAGRGLAHADQMLEVLASVRPCTKQPFSTLEHLVIERVGVVSGCVCVLLTWDDQRRSLVRKLEALGMPVTVIVVVDRGSPRPDSHGIGHAERFHVLEAGNIEAGLSMMQ